MVLVQLDGGGDGFVEFTIEGGSKERRVECEELLLDSPGLLAFAGADSYGHARGILKPE